MLESHEIEHKKFHFQLYKNAVSSSLSPALFYNWKWNFLCSISLDSSKIEIKNIYSGIVLSCRSNSKILAGGMLWYTWPYMISNKISEPVNDKWPALLSILACFTVQRAFTWESSVRNRETRKWGGNVPNWFCADTLQDPQRKYVQTSKLSLFVPLVFLGNKND